MKHWLVGLLFTLMYCVPLISQNKGTPFINNYGSKTYKASNQIWGIDQDAAGRVFFANASGLTEYDGKTWNTYPIKGGTTIRSIAVGKEGHIYAGAKAQFGYYFRNGLGVLIYVSLSDSLPAAERQFKDVWQTYSMEDGVYFATFEALFRWDGVKLKTWKHPDGFKGAKTALGKLYIKTKKEFLLLEKGELRRSNRSDEFMAFSGFSICDYAPDTLLVSGGKSGLFLYVPSQNIFSPFVTDTESFFKSHFVYQCVRLYNGNFALASLSGGILVIDAKGKKVHKIDKAHGLRDDAVYYLFEDKSRNLWAGTNNGISLIEITNPILHSAGGHGLESQVLSVARMGGDIYVGTTNGLFFKELASEDNFMPIGLEGEFVWDLLVDGNQLIAAGNSGVNVFDMSMPKKTSKHFSLNFRVFKIFKSAHRPGVYWAGTINGLYAILPPKTKGLAPDTVGIQGIKHQIRNIAEDAEGNVWAASDYSGVYEIKVSDSIRARSGVHHFDTLSGLPNMVGNYVFNQGGQIFANTHGGVLRFDKQNRKFVKAGYFGNARFDSLAIYPLVLEANTGETWAGVSNNNAINRVVWFGKKNPSGPLANIEQPFLRIPNPVIDFFLPEGPGQCWIGTSEGLFYCDLQSWNDSVKRASTYMTSVKDGTGKLLPLAGGLQLPYEQNTFTFTFAAPFYPLSENVVFSFKLEGYDKEWSAWTPENKAHYTNLNEGEYTFYVKSKDIYGLESLVSAYEFNIKPPWHRTITAWIFYAAALIGLITVISKLNSRRLKLDKLRLETLIRQRTAEIMQQKEEISAQAENLIEMNEQIMLNNAALEEQKQQIQTAYLNVKQLSEVGIKITSHLDVGNIVETVYREVNALIPADCFGIGVYNKTLERLEYTGFMESGEKLPFHYDDFNDQNSLAGWCARNEKEVVIGDFLKEVRSFLPKRTDLTPAIGKSPESVLYLPFFSKGRLSGCITAQSFEKNAYTDFHINILRNMAVYAATALENAESFHQLDLEKEKSEKLLLNILPAKTAEELKQKGFAETKSYAQATILFSDFKGFTHISEQLSPEELVRKLDECFKAFDRIVKKHGLEKIKTIGDAYMCAGGLPETNQTHPEDAVKAAFEMLAFVEQWNKGMENELRWQIRIGIHTGPLVAGVVGENKFSYDVWGDTVNTASRIETAGVPGRVNISGDTYLLLKGKFDCEHRGKIQAKGKGEIDMYFVNS